MGLRDGRRQSFFSSIAMTFETVCFIWLVHATRDNQHDNKLETFCFSPQASQIKQFFLCACLFFFDQALIKTTRTLCPAVGQPTGLILPRFLPMTQTKENVPRQSLVGWLEFVIVWAFSPLFTSSITSSFYGTKAANATSEIRKMK